MLASGDTWLSMKQLGSACFSLYLNIHRRIVKEKERKKKNRRKRILSKTNNHAGFSLEMDV